jgi:hypothetical protein
VYERWIEEGNMSCDIAGVPMGRIEARTVGDKTDVWLNSGSCTLGKLLLLLLLLHVKCPMLQMLQATSLHSFTLIAKTKVRCFYRPSFLSGVRTYTF